MTYRNTEAQAYCFALLTVVMWSTVASAFKMALRFVDVYQLLLLASTMASVVFFLVLAARGRLHSLLAIPTDEYRRLVLLGLLNPLLYYLVLFRAYDLLPAQVAQALNYTWAISLMLLSVPILGHRVTRIDVLAVVLCYFGALVICLGASGISDAPLNLAGVLLALGSTFVWALFWLYKTKSHTEAVAGLFISFLSSLPPLTLAWYLLSDNSAWPLAGILGGLYVGVVEMGVSFITWLTALRLTRSVASISTLIYLAPFLSLFFLHYLVGEAIATSTPAGLAIIVAGLLIQKRCSAAKKLGGQAD